MAAGRKNLKSVSKRWRLIFSMSLLLILSKFVYLATDHRKSIKIEQIQSKLLKLKLPDEIKLFKGYLRYKTIFCNKLAIDV